MLMNVNGSAPLPNYIAEELVDPQYKALSLPMALTTVRSVLFGSTPDRDMLNYRCRELLCLTHQTPLVEYITALDGRITYAFDSHDLVMASVWPPVIAKISGDGTLLTYGTVDPPDDTGKMRHSYYVTVDYPQVATVQRTNRPVQKVDIGFSAGDKIPLYGSGQSFKLSSINEGQAYTVDIYSRPQRDLATLADNASRLGEPVYNYLFGVGLAEPYKTFRGLWQRKQELPLKLGALVCALVYRTEEVRKGT